MRLSLSVRIAEKPRAKRQAALPLSGIAALAREHGYRALCMRASQVGIHTPPDDVAAAADLLRGLELEVSMVTGDFAIPENSDQGPGALRRIAPYLDLASALGCDLLRVALKCEDDIVWAQRAADAAGERGIRLAHQCHTRSLFEQVEPALAVLARIGRSNFGVIYEAANLAACGEAYGRPVLERLAPHIFNVYVQNQRLAANGAIAIETWSRGAVRFDPIALEERGAIDFEEIVDGLRCIGYAGFVTVHQAGGDSPGTVAADSARYLRRLARFD